MHGSRRSYARRYGDPRGRWYSNDAVEAALGRPAPFSSSYVRNRPEPQPSRRLVALVAFVFRAVIFFSRLGR